jgi:hypothetical protein
VVDCFVDGLHLADLGFEGVPRQPMAFLPRDGHRRGGSPEFTLPQIERPPSIPVCTENLNPDVVVMKSAKNGV